MGGRARGEGGGLIGAVCIGGAQLSLILIIK